MPLSDDAVLGAMQAEYTAMRDEISRLIDHEKELVNLSFVVLAAVLALIGSLAQTQPVNERAGSILLFVPMVYLMFSLTAAEQTRRILQIATYIQGDLRRRANALAGTTDLWRWEIFKAAHYESLTRPRKLRVWILERSRWITLTVPGITALIAYGNLVGYRSAMERVVLGLDISLILIQVGVLVYTTEAPGLRSVEE